LQLLRNGKTYCEAGGKYQKTACATHNIRMAAAAATFIYFSRLIKDDKSAGAMGKSGWSAGAMHSALHSIGIQLQVRSRDTSYRKLFAAARRIPLDKVGRESIPALSVIAARRWLLQQLGLIVCQQSAGGRATNWQWNAGRN
jgi:hypothetical protein